MVSGGGWIETSWILSSIDGRRLNITIIDQTSVSSAMMQIIFIFCDFVSSFKFVQKYHIINSAKHQSLICAIQFLWGQNHVFSLFTSI